MNEKKLSAFGGQPETEMLKSQVGAIEAKRAGDSKL